MNKKNAIHFQVLYRGRGYSRRASTLRAYKVKRTPPAQSGGTFQKVYDYQQLLSIENGVLKNDN